MDTNDQTLKITISGLKETAKAVEGLITFTKQEMTSINQRIIDTREELEESIKDLRKQIESSKDDTDNIVAMKIAELENAISAFGVIQKNQQLAMPETLITLLKTMGDILEKEPVQAIRLDDFKAHDQDESDEVDYYGYLHPSGAYYIVKGQEDMQRYVFGIDGYAEAWELRKKLTYGFIDKAFGKIKWQE